MSGIVSPCSPRAPRAGTPTPSPPSSRPSAAACGAGGGRDVWFRGLAVGSTTVVQYRYDAPPIGYLSRHLATTWFFQSPGDQRELARFASFTHLLAISYQLSAISSTHRPFSKLEAAC